MKLANRIFLVLCLSGFCAAQNWESVHDAGVKASKESRFPEAEKLLAQSLDIARHSSEMSPILGRNLIDMAEVYRTEGKYGQAQPLYEEALQVNAKRFGADSAEVAEVLDRHAELYKILNDYAHAEPMLQRALEIRKKKLPPDSVELAQAENDLGELYT